MRHFSVEESSSYFELCLLRRSYGFYLSITDYPFKDHSSYEWLACKYTDTTDADIYVSDLKLFTDVTNKNENHFKDPHPYVGTSSESSIISAFVVLNSKNVQKKEDFIFLLTLLKRSLMSGTSGRPFRVFPPTAFSRNLLYPGKFRQQVGELPHTWYPLFVSERIGGLGTPCWTIWS